MTDPHDRPEREPRDDPHDRPEPEPEDYPVLPFGEQYAAEHDPGPGELYAGAPVRDPWEEVPDGKLDSGAEPGEPES